MESTPWLFLVNKGFVPGDHGHLIARLQGIHDMDDPISWEHCLNKLAADFNLEPK